ncbi:hypothetical protein F8M41_014517 [Gigaspora margarita]|uniref:Uncharacterized protein n=1 Tax=Gigaspora margarita TaxID=4874 RepID=A0A8H4ENR3_GIGMA|nr:hypothetical protein F8M41_014517 [Gigaspora margarita]
MSHIAIQQEQATQREQRMKKQKSGLSIEDPILEVKAKTDEFEITTNIGINKETCTEIEIEEPKRKVPDPKKQQQELIDSSAFDIEDPILENNYPTSEMSIDEPRLSTVKNNNRDTKGIDKEKWCNPYHTVR